MEKLPTGLIGYKKSAVDELIKEKNKLLKTQQEDINYLRSELEKR